MLAIFVLGCVAGGIVMCEAALRVPRRTVAALPDQSSIRAVDIRAKDGIGLRAWMAQPAEQTSNCVMVLHGIGDSGKSALGFAPLFMGHGYAVLAPDSRGHGESGGDIVTYGVLEADDVHRWVDWLQTSEHCTNIFGLGESLGAAILIQSLAVETRFRAVVAESSYSSLARIGQDRMAQRLPFPPVLGHALAWPVVEFSLLYCRLKYGLDLRGAAPEAFIGRTHTPILLIHGLADSKTPPEHSRILAARNPRAVLWLVPGAEHTGAWNAAPTEFEHRVLQWFVY